METLRGPGSKTCNAVPGTQSGEGRNCQNRRTELELAASSERLTELGQASAIDRDVAHRRRIALGGGLECRRVRRDGAAVRAIRSGAGDRVGAPELRLSTASSIGKYGVTELIADFPEKPGGPRTGFFVCLD